MQFYISEQKTMLEEKFNQLISYMFVMFQIECDLQCIHLRRTVLQSFHSTLLIEISRISRSRRWVRGMSNDGALTKKTYITFREWADKCLTL